MPVDERCGNCHACLDGQTIDVAGFPLPVTATRMILCPDCGCKRCPKASDHRLACTASNEPGQPGSIYVARRTADVEIAAAAGADATSCRHRYRYDAAETARVCVECDKGVVVCEACGCENSVEPVDALRRSVRENTSPAVPAAAGVRHFRKRPVTVAAVQWTGANLDELLAFAANSTRRVELLDGELVIHTLEGLMRAERADWIVRGVRGELYPCKPDIFVETYEPVEAEAGSTADGRTGAGIRAVSLDPGAGP